MENVCIALSKGPGTPICEGLSFPLATSMALIFAATAAAASRAPVGAISASPSPPGPGPDPDPGPGWSHLLRRLKKNNMKMNKEQSIRRRKKMYYVLSCWIN